ncbi:MAG: hypothetical protein IPM38_13045 [Ignavibacteria bacterium]|nr:hypothetical protein [Ignavibacteria bacterium]
MIGLISSLDLCLELGLKNIFDHIQTRQNIFIDEIKDTDFKVESDLNPDHRSNILFILLQRY